MQLVIPIRILVCALTANVLFSQYNSMVYCREYQQQISKKELKLSIETFEPEPLLSSSVPTVYLVYENTGPASITVPAINRRDGIGYEVITGKSTRTMPSGTIIESYESTATRMDIPPYSGCSPTMQTLIPGERIRVNLSGELFPPWSNRVNQLGPAFGRGASKQLIRVYIGHHIVEKELSVVTPIMKSVQCIENEVVPRHDDADKLGCAYVYLLEADGEDYVSVGIHRDGPLGSDLSPLDLAKTMELFNQRNPYQIIISRAKSPIEWLSAFRPEGYTPKGMKIVLSGVTYSLEDLWQEYAKQRK